MMNSLMNYGKNHVSYWQPQDGSQNFGDCLSPIIAAQLLSQHGYTLADEVAKPRNLLAIGSILHFARNGDVIWGTGINGKVLIDLFQARALDIRAVRGPLTSAFLKKFGITAPAVYGDPALLLPRLFPQRFKVNPQRDYVFVPNLHDLPLVAGQPNVISPLWGWNRVVEEILTAKLVLASSLHGLVVAEAYGIPARYVRLSEHEHPLKYEDYYLGTGRSNFSFAQTIDEGLNQGGMPKITHNFDDLYQSFPLDLWQEQKAGRNV